MEPLNKKNIFYWSLYAFAKDVVVITFSLYFSQWLIVDNHVPDIWYNLIFVGASVLLLLTAPILAIIADKEQQALPYLRLMAILLFLTTFASSLFALYSTNIPKFVLFSAISFLLSNYFYQFSLVFYHGFLNQLAPPEKHGFVSGIDYAGNWLGAMTGVLISMPFALGTVYWFGQAGRAQTFLPATLLFLLLSLPIIILFKEKTTPIKVKINLKEEYKNVFSSFVKLCKTPGVGRFLLAFFLFNDAIVTLENNYAIYLQQVFHISDKIKSLLLLGVLIFTMIGAFISGWIADKIGLKKSMLIILTGLVFLFPAFGLVHNFILLAAFSVCLGVFYGSSWTVARAILTYLAPKDNLNHTFSYYSIVERFATLTGPLAWGTTILIFAKYGVWSYRIAIIILGLFVLLGAIIFKKIPSEKEKINFDYGTAGE